MNTLYLDIFSGISGDMFIGAMLDLGVDFESLTHELKKLGLNGYHLHFARQEKASISGIKFDVHLEPGDQEHDHEHHHSESDHEHNHDHQQGHTHDHDRDEHGFLIFKHQEHSHEHEHGHSHEHHHHDEPEHSHDHEEEEHIHQHGRTFAEIRGLIQYSDLSDWVKKKSIAIFNRIALAEGKIHGLPPESVHFHEVGALDSIVDIIGACVCLELLGKPRVLAGPVVEGTGWIKCAHGRFPIPAPATLNILAQRKIPLTQTDEPNELVTPTGAAILAEFAEDFGPMRNLAAEKIGFGLGQRDNKTRPNVLRAALGKTIAGTGSAHDWQSDTIAVLETNLDDINGEILGYFVEKCLAAGALDVFQIPMQMKKNRPGVLLSVLCSLGDQEKFCEMIFHETTALGVRRTTAERRKLTREVVRKSTSYGEVEIKVGKLNGAVIQVAPEFESCKKLALETGAPLKTIYQAALNSFGEKL